MTPEIIELLQSLGLIAIYFVVFGAATYVAARVLYSLLTGKW